MCADTGCRLGSFATGCLLVAALKNTRLNKLLLLVQCVYKRAVEQTAPHHIISVWIYARTRLERPCTVDIKTIYSCAYQKYCLEIA